ncbi:hypothetical protein [Paraburkholderia xenovorans]
MGYREVCVGRATALGVAGGVRNRMDAAGLAGTTDRNVRLAQRGHVRSAGRSV